MADKILKTCLLAGRIMIEGGSEMYRVDDTMARGMETILSACAIGAGVAIIFRFF